jgi:hypothetical protein
VRFVVDEVWLALKQSFFSEFLQFSPSNDLSTMAPYSSVTTPIAVWYPQSFISDSALDWLESEEFS